MGAERYARLRAAALPRIVAFRKAGNTAKNDNVADANSWRLERKPGVRERIDYLTRQAEDRIVEKRVALEEQLWSFAEADIGAFWETYEAAKTGKDGESGSTSTSAAQTARATQLPSVRKQRPKLLSELSPESRKLIEEVTVDRNGNIIPKLYSKAQANRDLRQMLRIGGQHEPEANNMARLTDAELIQQIAEQAKELGIEIDLNYRFAQPAGVAGSPTDGGTAVPGEAQRSHDGNVGPVINADQALPGYPGYPDYPGHDPTSANSANSANTEAGSRPARKPALPTAFHDTRPPPQRPQPTKPKPS